ncbi:phenylalanine--tRNA ligase subunit beta [Pontibacter sp. G13]|uniref:phenylalanine--tRNA ligase subunit beta n=1 Tax=Pontibacter sp. G13 TaxID=3074898 RepID=UPI00288A9FD6|nr:phenylalanine--tRNA ligase subunit beta [Pontibacter sp. G13]WNJ21331.1 phenylalanine--tRNA ligase subunit beta [Pontibacter sp. G13]
MKISYNWLKSYIDFDLSPRELADILTMLGLEIGKIEEVGAAPALDGVVVGLVESAVQHPNADRLRVCQVNIGEAESVQIVCGAPNVAAGQKVPVATIGTILTPFGKTEEESFKIKKGKIRGEASFGMICAEDELGLGEGHDGIMVLEESLVPGTPFVETMEWDTDHVLEVELTPNRIDGASHYGTARDLGAYLRKPAHLPEMSVSVESLATGPANAIPVKIDNTERCRRYTSILIEGVTVQESPEWMQKALRKIGLRPINNIVDITNFVLHELGHPMHAFDADKISGGAVHVRTFAEDFKFTTLDEVEREMKADVDLMICDAEKPLCIAGVMGGMNSGVTESTTRVFLESAYFDAGSVRKTSKRLGLSTDSSFRFERGADPHMTVNAALRATDLILQIAGGTASQVADQQIGEFLPFEVDLSLEKTNRLIGEDIGKDTILEILHALEIQTEESGDTLKLKVPPYRVDVQRDVDVIEDILRVYGYNSVAIPEKINATLTFTQYKDEFRFREHIANHLSATGFYEIMNNSLEARELGDDSAVEIVNPLSEDLGILRQKMIYGALETVRYNQNRQNENLALYEFGHVYKNKAGEYAQKSQLAVTVSGGVHDFHWESKSPKSSLATLTTVIERLQKWVGFEGKVREAEHEDFEYALEMVVDGRVLLTYGRVNQELMEKYDLRNEVFHMIVDWAALVDIYFAVDVKYKPVPQYPSIRRDISMLIDRPTSFAEIKDAVLKANPKLIRTVDLHDIYMGKGIPEGKKSYLVSVEMRDDNKTLADKAAEKIMQRAFQLLENQLGAEIRK